jgi:hypothetical protein
VIDAADQITWLRQKAVALEGDPEGETADATMLRVIANSIETTDERHRMALRELERPDDDPEELEG